jgi:hypothetical protein
MPLVSALAGNNGDSISMTNHCEIHGMAVVMLFWAELAFCKEAYSVVKGYMKVNLEVDVKGQYTLSIITSHIFLVLEPSSHK